jgi:hypothetical protein
MADDSMAKNICHGSPPELARVGLYFHLKTVINNNPSPFLYLDNP